VHDERTWYVSRFPIRGLGVRVFAVGVLVAGAATGITAGVMRGENDSLTATDKASPAEVATLSESIPTLSEYASEKNEYNRLQAEASRKRKAAAKAKEAARKAAERKAAAERASREADRGTSGGDAPPTPVDCQTLSGNKEIGCSLLPTFGFDTSEMSCLDPLWTRESHWRTEARNPSSGAGGIPQALPMSRMAEFGDDYETNPVTQIKWGLDYIKDRYGTPCDAWQHSEDVGWY
jgi:hypothetical protein